MLLLVLLSYLSCVRSIQLNSDSKWNKQQRATNYQYTKQAVNISDRDGGGHAHGHHEGHGGVQSNSQYASPYKKYQGGSPIEQAIQKLEQQFLYLLTHTIGDKLV